MNVNTVVEILISFLETGNWRESFQRAVPLRKVRSKDNTKDEYNYKHIQTEEALLSLSVIQLTKFEFKNVLNRYCVKYQKKLSFEKDEYDLKTTTLPKDEVSRFVVRALIDGKVMGEGRGGSIRVASAYASWRALKKCGVYDDAAEVVSECLICLNHMNDTPIL